MQITIGDYIIRPYQNGLCWTIDHYEDIKRKDGSVSKGWKNIGKFPSSLESAFNIIAERMLLDNAKEVVGDFNDAARAVTEFKEEILKKVTVATITSKKRK